jgi:TP901 family phage tail tape measure protein
VSDPGPVIEVTFTGDADQLAAALSKALEGAMDKSIAGIAASLRTLVNQSRRGNITAGITKGFEQATDSIRDMSVQLRRLVDLTESGFARGFHAATDSINDMDDALGRTQARVRGIAEALSNVRSPEDQLREYIRRAGQAEEATDELRDSRERAARDPGFGTTIRTEVRARQQAASTEKDILQELTRTFRTELAKQAEQQRVTQQGMTTAARAEASERIVALQTEAAREVAITKRSAQQRVEIIRGVVNQIRALERGIAAVLRTGARGFGNFASAAGRSVGRLGSIFGRSNREMSAGLGTAMNRRESILRTSMSRQERIMRSSVVRQSLQVQRLEAVSSRGIAGAVTGRSQLGALLGGGLAIGGGFALISKVKELATVGADFTQGLAVLDAQLDLTDKQMARVRETAIDLGNDMSLPGVSALQGAQAIQILAKQFGSLGDQALPAALAASKGVLQLSRATDSTAEDSAKIVGAAINVFGVSADKAVDVADQITGAMTKAAGVSLQDFALTFRQGAGTFAGFQTSVTGADQALLDFNTSIAVLAKGGLTGSDAGTSLKQFFLQATRGTVDADAAMQVLVERAGETGGAFFDAAGAARPLQQALDIIRRGMEGLSDEAKQKTLQKIFGSDASNAARLLLGTSTEVFDKIQDGIKRQGLAAEVAAAQNQGLRGAVDALNSIIETQAIRVYEQLDTILGNVVLTFANFLNNLISGEGVFKTIRTVLLGIAGGLGSIFAVKGVVEIFQFLLVLARGLLTPFGLLLTVAGLLGAGFALLMENSEAFREAIGKLKTTLSDVIDTAKTFVTDIFGGSDVADAMALEIEGIDTRTLGEKIGDRLRQVLAGIFDTLKRFAETGIAFITDIFTGSDFGDAFAKAITGTDTRTVGEKIGDKIREIFGFVRDAVTNVQQLLGDLFFGTDPADQFAAAFGGDTRSKFEKIGGDIRRVVTNIVDGIVDAFNTVRDVVGPILGPAVDGVKAFAGAIKELFELKPSKGLLAIGGILAGIAGGFAVAGPLGAAIGGLGAGLAAIFATGLGDELVGIFSGLGRGLLDALKGPFQTVKDFLSDFFDPDNLKDLAFGFLDLVEEVGRIIGSIVSDPRVVATVAGIAVFAATIAVRFVEGFARGVLENVPELAQLLRDAIGEAIEAAFSVFGLDLDIGKPIATALLAAFTGVGLLRLITNASEKLGLTAGRSLSEGVRKGMVSGPGAVGLGAGPRGLLQGLFGTGLEAGVRRDMAKVTGAIDTEIRRMQQAIRGAGRLDLLGPVTRDQAGLREIRRRFGEVQNSIGTARTAGLQFKEALGTIGQAAGRLDFRGMRRGLGDAAAALKGQGRNIGTAVGTAIAGALGVAFGIQMATESDNMADKVTGVLAIVGSVATAAAIGGPELAAITGALGLITSFLQGNASKAKEAEQAVDDYTAALGRMRDGAGTVAFVDTTLQHLNDTMSVELRQTFVDSGLIVGDWAAGVIRHTETAETGAIELVDGLGEAGAKMAELLRSGEVTAAGISDAFKRADRLEFVDPGPIKDLGTVFEKDLGIKIEDAAKLFDFLVDQSDASTEALERNFLAVQEAGGLAFDDAQWKAHADAVLGVGEAAKLTNDQLQFLSAIKLLGELDAAKQHFIELNEAAADALEGIQEVFDPALSDNLRQRMDDLIEQIPNLVSSLGRFDLTTIAGRAGRRSALDDFVTQFQTDLTDAISKGEITTLPQIRVEKRRMLRSLSEEVFKAIGREEITVEEGQAIIESLKTRFDAIDLGDLQTIIQTVLDAKPKPDVTVSAKGKVQLVIAEEGDLTPRQTGTKVQDFLDAHPKLASVNISVEGRPKLTITQDMDVSQIARRIRRQAAQLDPTVVDVPVTLNPAVTRFTVADLVAAVEDEVPTAGSLGPGNTGPAGFSRAIDTMSVDVPISVTPTVTISDVAGGAKAKVSEAVFKAVAGEDGLGPTVNVPLTVNPVVSVAGGSQADIGVGIAASIATGISAAAPQISAALSTAIGQAVRAGGQVTAVFSVIGIAAAGAFAAGITSGAGLIVAASTAVSNAAVVAVASNQGVMVVVGVSLGASFAGGLNATTGAASSAGAGLSSAAAGGASGFSLFSTGQNLAFSLASGILSGRSAVINAAISIANSAISAARATLQVASPSKVFRNIGRDIGRGLAEGIKDTETDITSAVNTAIDEAIQAAQRDVPAQVAQAALAAGIFERTTLPSRLPGGVPDIEVERTLTSTLDAIQELVDQGEERKDRERELIQEIKDTRTTLGEDLKSLKVEAFAKPAAGLPVTRARVELGGLAGQFAAAFKEAFTTAEEGETPAQREKRLARTAQAQSLNIRTAAGREATNLILDFGQQIRDLGTSMLEGGASARETTRAMQGYRDQLISAAKAAGINGGALRDLIRDLGLTDRQLARFGDTAKEAAAQAREAADRALVDLRGELAETRSRRLGPGTAAGRVNRTIVTDALDAIRDFGRTALEAGRPVAQVREQMAKMRDELVKNLVEMGFNTQQIQQLVNLMGLSNAQLAEFTGNLAAANDEFQNPPTPSTPGLTIGPGGRLPAHVGEIHVHVPFGDPEAVALATTNRLAFELNAPA